MDAIKLHNKKYTYEDYLELEKTSEIKHELYYGEIFSMAGTTLNHNEIVFNTTLSLKKELKKKNKKCSVYSEALKVQIKEKLHYTYPDVVLTCSETEDDDLTIKNPIIIVEVLSESTRVYDRNQKFTFYKQISSLKHYILIEQDFCFINCYTNDNNVWHHKSYFNLEDIIYLTYIEIALSVKDIYQEIVFTKKQRFT